MENISYLELANCQDYAEKVISFYKLRNNGKMPMNASDAESAVIEYNNEHCRFKALYGYSISRYVQNIVDCIGFIVEQ